MAVRVYVFSNTMSPHKTPALNADHAADALALLRRSLGAPTPAALAALDRLEAALARPHLPPPVPLHRDGPSAPREEATHFRLLAENSEDVLIIFDPEMRITYCNQAVQKSLGFTTEEMCAMRLEDFMTPQAQVVTRSAFDRRMALEASGMPLRGAQRDEMLLRRKDGREIWFECVTSPLRDGEDSLTGVLIVARNISMRKAAENALKRSEARLRMALEATSDGVWDMLFSIREDGFEVLRAFHSENIPRNLGYLPEEFNAPTAHLHLIHPDDLPRVGAALGAHLLGRSERFMAEFRMRRKDGIWVWILSRGRVVERNPEEGTARIVGTHTDVQGRKLAEAALRREEEKYRLLVENQTDLVVKLDPVGRFLYVSPSFCRMFGKGEQELLSENFFALIHAEDRPAAQKAVEALGAPPHSALREHRAMTRHGLRWLSWTATAVLDEAGRVSGIIAVGRDVSERKEMEQALVQAKEDAEAASRAKSDFLANMSHEIRNPLNAVLGLADLMLLGELPEEQRERAVLLKNSAASLLGVITDILEYSKIEAGSVEVERYPFKLPALLRGLAAEQRMLATEKGVALKLSLDPRLPERILGDELKIRQILLNLLSNAMKFTPEGSVEIIARVQERRDARVTLLFAVSDTGIGVPEDKQEIIFESFRQAESGLRKRHGGTGLGLAICKRLAEIMGGSIWLQSEPGQGSIFCFTVEVELAPREEPRDMSAPGARAESTAPLRVLLVEDDWINRRFTTQLLERQGHSVREAENGSQALQILSEHPVDLVIMDMQMPVMDGISATRAIRAAKGCPPERADVPIIGLTAYATSEDRDCFLAAGVDICLTKPLRAQRLLRIMDEVVAQKRGQTGAVSGTSPAPVAESPDGLLNERMLTDHLELGTESFLDLLRHFEDDAARRLARLMEASDQGALSDAAELAHSLAGSAGVIGGAGLRRHCLELEKELRAGGPRARLMAEQVWPLAQRTMLAIRERIDAQG
ncbi:PAS/PAC sensor hybrid histidine kinase [Desulfovibrio sp. X2]|uniref:PAS domain S-box protein n=1 Tax=Desulfovibrio sp. X2 TaxID=941449 RepID=UPI000358D14B|nr:PAS domain S-box protein [Desulfovibrio sp. X2]EPR43924.1 PAS/PAC sensor hybrid histidine kinase [Desulfovibrio sp. X2]